MSHPAVRRSRMFCAKPVMLVNAVAKYNCAPGARSWMISSIAVPSSPLPVWPANTVTGPRSPSAWLAARLVTPSDRTPTLMPVPSTWNVPRASYARCVRLPSEFRLP